MKMSFNKFVIILAIVVAIAGIATYAAIANKESNTAEAKQDFSVLQSNITVEEYSIGQYSAYHVVDNDFSISLDIGKLTRSSEKPGIDGVVYGSVKINPESSKTELTTGTLNIYRYVDAEKGIVSYQVYETVHNEYASQISIKDFVYRTR